MIIKEEDYIEHVGIMGMKWGRRSTSSKISSIKNKNKGLKDKLDKTINKSEKNKIRSDKLTKKLTKHGSYMTDIGYTMAKNTGRKLARSLNKDKKLAKKIDRIKNKLETNKQSIKTMNTKMKDLNVS